MLVVWKPHADLDCRLDLVEERLDHAVVARLDPLAPELFVLSERLTVDRVEEECPAIERLDLEPVLRLQPVRTDDTEGADCAWTIRPPPRASLPSRISAVRGDEARARSVSARPAQSRRRARRPAPAWLQARARDGCSSSSASSDTGGRGATGQRAGRPSPSWPGVGASRGCGRGEAGGRGC